MYDGDDCGGCGAIRGEPCMQQLSKIHRGGFCPRDPRPNVQAAMAAVAALPPPEPVWISVSPDAWTRWEVNLDQFDEPVAVTLCERRDTGTEYARTLKPWSANWRKAVRLATALALRGCGPVSPLGFTNALSALG